MGVGGMEILLIWVISFVLWIWALIDVLRSNFRDNGKIIWILVILFVPVIGSILYLLIGRKQKS